MNQKGVGSYASSSSISAHAEPTIDFDDHGLRYSPIEVELGNVREHQHEPATYRVDVLRFLKGFPNKNASQLGSHHSEQTLPHHEPSREHQKWRHPSVKAAG
jgi:hypothetical protein